MKGKRSCSGCRPSVFTSSAAPCAPRVGQVLGLLVCFLDIPAQSRRELHLRGKLLCALAQAICTAMPAGMLEPRSSCPWLNHRSTGAARPGLQWKQAVMRCSSAAERPCLQRIAAHYSDRPGWTAHASRSWAMDMERVELVLCTAWRHACFQHIGLHCTTRPCSRASHKPP